MLPSVSTCTAPSPIDPRPEIGSAHTPPSCPSVPLLLFLITATCQLAQICSLVLSPLLGHRPLSCIIAGAPVLPSCLYPPILPSVSLTDSATTSLYWAQSSHSPRAEMRCRPPITDSCGLLAPRSDRKQRPCPSDQKGKITPNIFHIGHIEEAAGADYWLYLAEGISRTP